MNHLTCGSGAAEHADYTDNVAANFQTVALIRRAFRRHFFFVPHKLPRPFPQHLPFFDLENGIYADLIVQKEHEKNECRALCQMAERSRVSGKVILLADRNYESCNNLAHLEKKGWNYLIRVRDKDRVIAYGTSLPDQPEFDIPLKLTLGRLTRR